MLVENSHGPDPDVQSENGVQCFYTVSRLNDVFLPHCAKRCATGFEVRFLSFGGCVRKCYPISSDVYINLAVYKRQFASETQQGFQNTTVSVQINVLLHFVGAERAPGVCCSVVCQVYFCSFCLILFLFENQKINHTLIADVPYSTSWPVLTVVCAQHGC